MRFCTNISCDEKINDVKSINEKAKKLIAAGVNINAKDENGRTVLHNFSFNPSSQKDMVLLSVLLSHGANLCIKDINGHTPFEDKIKPIIYPLQENGYTPLHFASIDNNKSNFSAILETTENIDQQTKDGKTPLMCALEAGKTEVALFLIMQGADYKLEDKNSNPTYSHASDPKTKEMLELLNRGINSVNRNGYAPIHFATGIGETDLVTDFISFLLEKGANINHQAIDGTTPLMNAKRKGVASFLQSNGAIATEQSMYEKTEEENKRQEKIRMELAKKER